MLQSNSANFIEQISENYKSFKKEILPVYLGDNICKNMKEETSINLFKYQEFLFNYMKDLNEIPEEKLKQRGLLVYHGLGSGKTFSGILLSEAAREYKLSEKDEEYKTKKVYDRKVILMMPASLLFDPWIKELSSKCYTNCKIRNLIKKELKKMKNNTEDTIKKHIIKLLKEHDYYIIFYNAQNIEGGWRDKLNQIPTRKMSGDKYNNKYSERNNEFDDSVIIIDEMHNIINMFANKVENNNTSQENLMLYHKLVNAKNARIIGLTGSPIVNRPFEIAIIANIIRGKINNEPEIKFDLDIHKFNALFLNEEMTELKNEKMLKRRLNGLVSYYKGIDNSVFAQKVEDKVLVPLSNKQANGYNIAQKLELKQRRKARKSGNQTLQNSFLYRIKASNVVLPDFIFDMKIQQRLNLTKNKKVIPLFTIKSRTKLLGEKFDKTTEKKVIELLDNDNKPLNIDNDLSDISKKVYHIIKRAKESNGPVLIYSRFEGLYGIKFITEALKQNGFGDYDKNTKKQKDTFMIWTGKHRNNATKNIFNSFKNKNGELIKIFCMTSSGKEGISLLGIRQIHILEPWWNNIIDRQVIGRGIRICSHHHIKESDFIDFRLDQDNKLYNTRMVNVFKYYSYLDMRYRINSFKNKSKSELNNITKIIRSDMIDTSIDDLIMKIGQRKEIQEVLILDIIKEVAIDCNINKERNQSTVVCFKDNKNIDYFKSWNVKDEYLPEFGNNRMKLIKYNNKKYLVTNYNIVYIDLQNDNILDMNSYSNDLLKVGIYKDNEIIFDDNHVERINQIKTKNNIVITNNIKIILSDILEHNLKNKSVLDITKINKDTVLYQRMFEKLDILLLSETDSKINTVADKLAKLSNTSIIKTENINDIYKKQYDYINIDTNVMIDMSIENLINSLSDNSKYIILNVNTNTINTSKILNDFYYNKKYNIMVIDNSKVRNSLMKFVKDNFKLKEIENILNDFDKLDINSLEKLITLIKKDEFHLIEHSIKSQQINKIQKIIKKDFKEKIIKKKLIKRKTSPLPKSLRTPKKSKSKSKSKKVIKDSDITNIKDCMKTSLSKIKKSKEYKNLPKNIGKSKLSKKALCKELEV